MAIEKWLSTTDAAKCLGVTLRTLYRFIDDGSLPAYKLGRVIRLKEKEVEEFIKDVQIQPGTLKYLYPNKK